MLRRTLFCIITAALLFASCRSTKYVDDNEYLLTGVRIDNCPKHIAHEDAMRYVRQRPNVKILGFWRMGLGLYNMSGRNDKRGINNWLKRIGEAPVVYDSTLRDRSTEQLTLFFKSKGYFNAIVTDSVVIRGNKKLRVHYNVNHGDLYRINKMSYAIDDDSLRPIVLADTVNSVLKKGDPFDSEVHDDERDRVTRALREKGYYHFNKDYIYFAADSTSKHAWINDSMVLMLNRTAEDDDSKVFPHKKSIVDSVFFLLGDMPQQLTDESFQDMESIKFGPYILYNNGCELTFHADLLARACFIEPGKYYNVLDVEQTQSRFNNLKLFKSVNIRFREVAENADTSDCSHLRCIIQLLPAIAQSYSVEVEGTNSSGNLGGAGNIRYQHVNMFKKAEVFDVKLRLATQNQFARDGKERFYTLETGLELSLTFPKFLAPFSSNEFAKRRNPSTSLSLAYDYQRRPDFTRSVLSSRLIYSWRGSKYVWHSFSPLDLNIVSIPTISQNFSEYISGTYLQYSYTDHLIAAANYSFLFNQQNSRGRENAWFARLTIETAGNMLNLATSLKSDNANEGYRDILGLRFSQYVKVDADLRYLVFLNKANSFAYRFFGGVGVPYGNSKALPFEKSFFVGGANSIRAWPVRGLGPGSSKGNTLRYHNQTSDIRLEANMEYRFKLISVFEGAFFADAGNIWALKRTTDSNDERFDFSSFGRQIALGIGAGLRLNFDYFIFRIDAGAKVHDPSEDDGKRWVLTDNRFTWGDVNWNFAIGYPF